MFGHRYFGRRYFGPRYFGSSSQAAQSVEIQVPVADTNVVAFEPSVSAQSEIHAVGPLQKPRDLGAAVWIPTARIRVDAFAPTVAANDGEKELEEFLLAAA